jgi:hypothetical protein
MTDEPRENILPLPPLPDENPSDQPAQRSRRQRRSQQEEEIPEPETPEASFHYAPDYRVDIDDEGNIRNFENFISDRLHDTVVSLEARDEDHPSEEGFSPPRENSRWHDLIEFLREDTDMSEMIPLSALAMAYLRHNLPSDEEETFEEYYNRLAATRFGRPHGEVVAAELIWQLSSSLRAGNPSGAPMRFLEEAFLQQQEHANSSHILNQRIDRFVRQETQT